MLQQRRIEILYHKFPLIFRGIVPENFYGKIPQKFPEIYELTTLVATHTHTRYFNGHLTAIFQVNLG